MQFQVGNELILPRLRTLGIMRPGASNQWLGQANMTHDWRERLRLSEVAARSLGQPTGKRLESAHLLKAFALLRRAILHFLEQGFGKDKSKNQMAEEWLKLVLA